MHRNKWADSASHVGPLHNVFLSTGTSLSLYRYIGQGHDVKHSQWCHSMVNINLYTSRTWAFFASFHRFPDIEYYDFQKFCNLENIGQGHDIHQICNVAVAKRIPWLSTAEYIWQIMHCSRWLIKPYPISVNFLHLVTPFQHLLPCDVTAWKSRYTSESYGISTIDKTQNVFNKIICCHKTFIFKHLC